MYLHNGLDGTCLTAEDAMQEQIYVRQCLWSGDNPQQSWIYHEGTKRLQNKRTGKCLSSKATDGAATGLMLAPCGAEGRGQTQWDLSGIDDPL